MEAPPDALTRDSPTIRAIKDISFGSIAGMASKVFEHPFDLTKVRLQSQVLSSSSSTAHFTGPLDCLSKTFLNEGVRGLYRGLPAPIVGAMAENASLFLVYGELQSIIRTLTDRPLTTPPSMAHLALAAAGAGFVTSFLLTPIELVKCKMQVQMLSPSFSSGTRASLPGPLQILTHTIRTTGLSGLWLGHTGTLIRETGGTAAWFSTKEFVARLLLSRRSSSSSSSPSTQLRPWESALSGACAGAAFNLALFPADTIKSAMQTESELRPSTPSSSSRPPSFLATARAMYAAQGIRGLYAGCGITVARSIPSSALIFLIYDGLSKHFA